LAIVSVPQFVECLSGRQAVAALRGASNGSFFWGWS